MQKRCGKFMADWRDAKGIRHRKAFPTAAEAIAHVQRMNETKNNPSLRVRSRTPPRTSRKPSRKTRTSKRR